MSQVNCLYCGASMEDDAEHCPECGKTSHFRKKGSMPMTHRQFMIMFVLVTILCAFLIVWFPRDI